ncbi:hypothetical protein MLD38_018594 [Melastoma candidum]|uniref:Uncharacterized protein n=1 Tax=Melastoma candidum TaxID=119954 RepID=A0ACB9QUC4_9MYRT|nr:hypothetical protein MLD38_018594 [Melastoma candidum]
MTAKGNQLDAGGSGLETVFQNGNSGMTLPQNERVPGTSHGSPTLQGLPAYIPPGAVNALHPFIMHQQGLPHPVNSNVPPEAEHHSSVPSVSIMQRQAAAAAAAAPAPAAPTAAPATTDSSTSSTDSSTSNNGQQLQQHLQHRQQHALQQQQLPQQRASHQQR